MRLDEHLLFFIRIAQVNRKINIIIRRIPGGSFNEIAAVRFIENGYCFFHCFT